GIMLCAMGCIGSIIPLNKHKIDALNHHRFVSSEAYQKLSYPAVAFIKGSTYYVSLIVPYLPKTHQVMFIESCADLPHLVDSYGAIEWITDREHKCALNHYDVSPLYESGDLESVVVKSKTTHKIL
ncbi:hypothetical protein, partial [uncultured Helicobacter sp.]|uniref:hypothetical protein n=1 Tax=uncultured Helicobacter sp. TaxID=175537 RepID=UPI002615499E